VENICWHLKRSHFSLFGSSYIFSFIYILLKFISLSHLSVETINLFIFISFGLHIPKHSFHLCHYTNNKCFNTKDVRMGQYIQWTLELRRFDVRTTWNSNKKFEENPVLKLEQKLEIRTKNHVVVTWSPSLSAWSRWKKGNSPSSEQ
jgi:hypothetical protein